MNKENLLEALDSVVWYNDLSEFLMYVKKSLTTAKEKNEPSFITVPCHDDTVKAMCKDPFCALGQYEMFWMILVELFGDYGISPRSGWLYVSNYDAIIEFIDQVTKTARKYSKEKNK